MTAGAAGRHGALLGAAVLAAALSACYMAPVRIASGQLTSDRALAAARGPAAARPGATLPVVRFEPVVDQRGGATDLGVVAGHAVSAERLPAWVDEELAGLASDHFAVASPATPAPASARSPVLTGRPRILKAYVASQGVTKKAVVVLQVDYSPAPDPASASRFYRGQHASMNWDSADDEIIGALREALEACLEQVRSDVEARLYPAGVPAPKPIPAAPETAPEG